MCWIEDGSSLSAAQRLRSWGWSDCLCLAKHGPVRRQLIHHGQHLAAPSCP